MADTRLSDRSAAGALSASDLFYVVQTPGSGGEKATGAQLLTLVGTTYVPLAGGTMTGALTLPAGAVGTPSLMFTGAGATTGIFSHAASTMSFAANGTVSAFISNEGFQFRSSLYLGWVSGGGANASSPDLIMQRDSAGALALRFLTQQHTLRIYNTYTDASNYERLTLTGVAGTSVNITAETLGTGADNIDLVLTPAGTGRVRVPSGVYNLPGIAFNAYPTTGFWLNSGGDSVYTTIGSVAALKVSALTIGFHSAGVLSWSSSGTAGQNTPDAGFSRNADGIVEFNNGTAGTFRDVKLRNLLQTEYSQLTEMTAPAAPATNSVRIYAEDNGAGKTRLMALFATGAAQQIAIEP